MRELNLKQKDLSLYLPEPVRILRVVDFTAKEKFFELEFLSGRSLGHVPGQFVQVSILGIGEAPISISSPPGAGKNFDLCVRAVGSVTNKMHTLKAGDVLHVRGPFGHGFDAAILQRMQNKQLLIIAGGLGYVPARSLINKVVPEAKNYSKISILCGCKSPADRLYTDELQMMAALGGKVEVLETVDRGDDSWKGNVGVITTLIPKVTLVPQETMAVLVGPPVMYKFVVKALKDRQLPNENIYMSLERRMKCGVGKCGHCQMEGVYVCQEGPVFNYADIEDNEEAI